jgi:hypothetical protein
VARIERNSDVDLLALALVLLLYLLLQAVILPRLGIST